MSKPFCTRNRIELKNKCYCVHYYAQDDHGSYVNNYTIYNKRNEAVKLFYDERHMNEEELAVFNKFKKFIGK